METKLDYNLVYFVYVITILFIYYIFNLSMYLKPLVITSVRKVLHRLTYNEPSDIPKKQFTDEDPKSNLKDAQDAKKLLDELIENKFEYYLYKDILPYYVQNATRTKLDKEKFKELKETFYNDIKMSTSPVVVRRLNYLFTPRGIGLYIHSRFSTLFNKVDSKFVNKDAGIPEKNGFFV